MLRPQWPNTVLLTIVGKDEASDSLHLGCSRLALVLMATPSLLSGLTAITVYVRTNNALSLLEAAALPSVFTLGKGFAECSTRQRPLGKIFLGKGCLPSVFFTGHSAK